MLPLARFGARASEQRSAKPRRLAWRRVDPPFVWRRRRGRSARKFALVGSAIARLFFSGFSVSRTLDQDNAALSYFSSARSLAFLYSGDGRRANRRRLIGEGNDAYFSGAVNRKRGLWETRSPARQRKNAALGRRRKATGRDGRTKCEPYAR